MKAVVDAKTFSAALDHTMAAMKRSRIPILESVQLRFGNGVCAMTATNLNTWLTVEIPAQGDTFTCGFYRTREAAKTCRYYDGTLTIEAIDIGEGRKAQRKLHLSCGSRRATYDGFPPLETEDFPAAPIEEDGEVFATNAASLLERINRIKYAVGKNGDDSSGKRTCVQFDRGRIFCMDGCRVACDNNEDLLIPRPFLIYPDALSHLKLFGDRDISICAGIRYITFSGGGIHLLCQRQGVEPFQLDQALPKEFREEFYVSPKEFLRELDYLKGLISNKRRPVLRFCGGEISLESSPTDGCTEICVEGRNSIQFGFDVHYMIDALKQFEKEPQVRLKIASSYMPIILDAEGRKDFALIMPARLREVQVAA